MSPSQLAAVGEGEVTAQLARAATLVTCFGPRAAPPRHVAAHLRRLQLRLTFLPRLENWIGGDADAEAVLSAVLTAAGSGGQLQELSLHTTNLPHLAIGGWPVTMPRLRRLRIQLDGCDVSNAEWHPAVYVGAAASSLRSLQCLELGAGSLSRMDCAPSQVTRLAWQERWEHSEPGFDLAQVSWQRWDIGGTGGGGHACARNFAAPPRAGRECAGGVCGWEARDCKRPLSLLRSTAPSSASRPPPMPCRFRSVSPGCTACRSGYPLKCTRLCASCAPLRCRLPLHLPALPIASSTAGTAAPLAGPWLH